MYIDSNLSKPSSSPKILQTNEQAINTQNRLKAKENIIDQL